jgi:hypothetical protein
MFIGVGQAGASHLRYSSISAQSTGGDSYTFSFSQGQAGCGTIGNTFAALALVFGDAGSPSSPASTITATQCVGLSALFWQFGPATVSHTYDASLHGQTVTAYSDGSCRVTLENLPFNCTMRSEATFVVGSGDSTPSMSVPPVVYCKTGQTCTFSIPATDADADPLRWRMSTDAEMGGTANPGGMTVNGSTGTVTWDTSGRNDGLWAANVTVEELDNLGAPKGKTAADFIVALGNYDAPTFVGPSPADASTLTATVGQPFTVALTANAPSGKTATLSSLVIPAWLTCPFAAAADPATVTCTGTPTASGATALTVLATASDGPQSTRSYAIAVAATATSSSTTTTTTTTPTTTTTRTTTTTPAPAAAPAPTSAPAPPPPPVEAQPVAPPASGFVAGDDLAIKVGNAGDAVAVSTTPDLANPVRIEVRPDGTISYPVPKGVEGKITLYVVRPSDGSVAELSFDVDTKAPEILRVDNVASPVKAPAAATTAAKSAPTRRKFFRVSGSDGGSGIVALQISPRAGKTWGWRSFVPKFSAPLKEKTVKVRIQDRAGNVSGWFVVPVTAVR